MPSQERETPPNENEGPARQRFLVITTARSGSNQLVDYINQTKVARCFGEVFKQSFLASTDILERQRIVSECFSSIEEARTIHATDPEAFWHTICIRARGPMRFIGAKLFYEHREKDAFWRNVMKLNPLIIHLWRAPVLESFLSLVRAETTKIWTVRKTNALTEQKPQLVFDESRYLRYRNMSRTRFQRVRNRKAEANQYFEIEYEQIAAPTLIGSTLNSIFGVKATYSATLVKQAPDDPLENIENRSIAERYLADRLDQ